MDADAARQGLILLQQLRPALTTQQGEPVDPAHVRVTLGILLLLHHIELE
ncbi:hypothetical protein [Plantactinospora soyae]|uniref:Uncharacterized protein n=1 Tax=Plantactinospora soyae TaxID=1544732 RepID=A0A927M5C0_9ACTN|nr:hypothetical protein [Plantactinospora soyae]MBE1484765.1 hypothetical protein [Plantactinospora soyae]